MEMPVDILNKELGAIRDNGDIDFDNTMAAVNIDTILQEKFLAIPYEELEAVEIEDDRGVLNAGSGPEHCKAEPGENPNWLYNHGINALALWWRLRQDAQSDEAKVAKRPAPGVYKLWTGGEQHTAIVTADRRIICPTHRNAQMSDFTDIYDGLGDNDHWVFTPIETGLRA